MVYARHVACKMPPAISRHLHLWADRYRFRPRVYLLLTIYSIFLLLYIFHDLTWRFIDIEISRDWVSKIVIISCQWRNLSITRHQEFQFCSSCHRLMNKFRHTARSKCRTFRVEVAARAHSCFKMTHPSSVGALIRFHFHLHAIKFGRSRPRRWLGSFYWWTVFAYISYMCFLAFQEVNICCVSKQKV